MKKPKTTAAPANTPAVKPLDAKHPYGLPTPEQLAQLAATLARRTDDNPTLLARAALKLWQAAETVHLEATKYYSSPADIAAYKATLPSLPMTRDDFLRMALPNARPEDRERAWKHYNLTLAGKDRETATVAEENAALVKWKSPATPAEYILTLVHFQTWWKKYHAADVSKTRSDIRTSAIKAKAKAKAQAKDTPAAQKAAKKKVEKKPLSRC